MVKQAVPAVLALIGAMVGMPSALAAEDAPFRRAVRADYANPTDRYPHDIMGRLSAHTDLVVRLEPCATCGSEVLAVRLPATLVFEDFAPRLVDLDSDGRDEVVVVESDRDRGSRLAVWDIVVTGGKPGLARAAATEFIGTRFRWLAPVGAADFDGDGTIELAYVEKPHLDPVLHFVRREGGVLRRVASVRGVTNHAIGQEAVESRIEVCAGVPTIFALDGGGGRVLSARLRGGAVDVADMGAAAVRHRLDARDFCGE